MKRTNSQKLQNGVKKISSLVKFRSKGKEEMKKSAPEVAGRLVSTEETEKFQKFFKDFNKKYEGSDVKTKQEALFQLMNREEINKKDRYFFLFFFLNFLFQKRGRRKIGS